MSASVTGITPGVVDERSRGRGEPRWMTALRMQGLHLFEQQPMAERFASIAPHIDVRDIDVRDLDVRDIDVSARPAGEHGDVGEQLRKELEARGILFCDMHTALREHPDLVKQYFGTVVSAGDNRLAALNTSVWSGGSFVYVPSGVECEMPIQVDLRTNPEIAGGFARTLIIADEGARVHYIEGCSAPVYTSDSLHSTVVEIVVRPRARVTYTTIQNWSPNVVNLVTKRARVDAGAHIEWIDGNIGSKRTMARPSVHLVGEGASAEVRSVSYAGAGQHHDVGAEIVHAAPGTSSKIVSKSINNDGGVTTHGGLVRIERGAHGCTSHVQCDALILDDDSVATTAPELEVGEHDADICHGSTISTIAAGQIFYLQARGLSEPQAAAMVVNGFIEPITRMLPLEYAVEWSRLIGLQMEGSVG